MNKKNTNKNIQYMEPPTLDQVFYKIKKRIIKFINKKPSIPNNIPNNINIFIIIILIISMIYIISGIYIVEPAEQAVITRFGKYNRTVSQGPHWLPRFIENKETVNTEKLERSGHGSSMLTKDENIIIVEIEVQYRTIDIEKKLFNLVEPNKTLKEAADSALRQIIGQSNLDFIVTSGKEHIANAIHEQLQITLDNYETGIHIATVALKDAKVPNDVKSSFDDVIKAQEEKEQLKHQAEAFANKIVPEAKGQAAQMIEEANAYKQEIILLAEGDVTKFNLILPEYQKAPNVTKIRLYINTMEKILSNTTKILIDIKNSGNIIFLPLEQIINKKNLKNNNINKSKKNNF